jgi:hypothetical protein
METNFKKPREVFVHHGLKKKISSIFFTGSTSWENRSHISASFFRFSVFSVSVLILRELFRRAGDEIGETEGGFSPKNSYTITSFIFYTGVTVEEKQMSELTPFLQQFDPSFMVDSSDF